MYRTEVWEFSQAVTSSLHVFQIYDDKDFKQSGLKIIICLYPDLVSTHWTTLNQSEMTFVKRRSSLWAAPPTHVFTTKSLFTYEYQEHAIWQRLWWGDFFYFLKLCWVWLKYRTLSLKRYNVLNWNKRCMNACLSFEWKHCTGKLAFCFFSLFSIQ